MADGARKDGQRASVSLNDKRDAVGTVGWFVSNATFPPRPYVAAKPLINGERAFAKVQEIVAKAKRSIAIMSWGFDPSMRMLPPDGIRIGDLLIAKAREGVEVRVLIWESWLAAAKENNLPGNGLGGAGGTALGSGIGSTSAGGADRSEQDNGYGHATGSSAAIARGDDEARAFNREWFSRQADAPHLEFHTQGFNRGDKWAIYAGNIFRNGISHPARGALLGGVPSHHQKMILVDYEVPESATGLVMGHNLMRNYWDTDGHIWADSRRLGFLGWQDVSCQVWGSVLYDMQQNFRRAWERSTQGNGKLGWSRDARTRQATDFADSALKHGSWDVAQLCRTQSQENDKSIVSAYENAIDNARSYLYFENQYFRYKPLADRLRKNRRKLKAAGWKRELYVFVVTNLPDESVAETTYEMLAALGQGDRLPSYHKQKSNPQEEALRKADLQGVKIHVASLLNSGLAPEKGGTGANFPSSSVPVMKQAYEPIYVHSKLLLTDDKHFLIGSANINERSMHVDSELALNCPSPSVTRQWRHDLWRMHTRQAVSDNMKAEFERWRRILESNSKRMKDKQPLIATLIDFQSDVKVRPAAD